MEKEAIEKTNFYVYFCDRLKISYPYFYDKIGWTRQRFYASKNKAALPKISVLERIGLEFNYPVEELLQMYATFIRERNIERERRI